MRDDFLFGTAIFHSPYMNENGTLFLSAKPSGEDARPPGTGLQLTEYITLFRFFNPRFRKIRGKACKKIPVPLVKVNARAEKGGRAFSLTNVRLL